MGLWAMFWFGFLPCKKNNVAPLFKGPLNSTDSYSVKKEISFLSIGKKLAISLTSNWHLF